MTHRTTTGVVRAAFAAALLFAGAASAALPESARADEAAKDEKKEEKKKSVDADAVYFGDCRNWSRPAAVDMGAVFREISEYKEILDKKLETSDARYGVLLSKARARFRDAVRAAAKDGSYDLVAKVGAVKGVDSVPVITQDVIKKL